MSDSDSKAKVWLGGMVLLFALCAGAVPVSADQFHYKNNLIGERASGLAGAYTAVSDSPAGCFYNPAGMVYIPGNSLSASVNAYNYSRKVYKNTLTRADGTGADYEQKSSVLLPNYFGFVSNFGRVKIGLSYAVPDASQSNQKQVFSNLVSTIGTQIDRYTININDVDNTYQFGPSLALALGEKWAIGTTVYAHYRHATVIRNQLVELANQEFEWTNQYQDRTDWGVQPKLGLMGELTDKLTLGLTVSRLWITSTDYREQTTYRGISSSGYSDPNLVDFTIVNSENKPTYPWVTTVGLAWFPSPRLLLSCDASYYSEVSGASAKEATFNLAAGVEYYFTDRLALRGGLFTDRSNTPDLQSGLVNQAEHVDLYGGTLSMTRFTKASATTLGVGYATGSGDAQMGANSTRSQTVEVDNLSVYLSASYNF